MAGDRRRSPSIVELLGEAKGGSCGYCKGTPKAEESEKRKEIFGRSHSENEVTVCMHPTPCAF